METGIKCSVDKKGDLHWQVYLHRPNTIIASLILVISVAMGCFIFFHRQSDFCLWRMENIFALSFPQWFLIILLSIIYVTCIAEIGKRIFGNYIVGIFFCEKNIQLLYKKGKRKIVNYDTVGFVYFILTEGSIQKRFCPSFCFYRKDESSMLTDDVLNKKDALIFKAEVYCKRDYLLLKEFFRTKGFPFHEPEGTLEMFEKRQYKWNVK